MASRETEAERWRWEGCELVPVPMDAADAEPGQELVRFEDYERVREERDAAAWEAKYFICTNCKWAIPFERRLPGVRCGLCPYCRHPLRSAEGRQSDRADRAEALLTQLLEAVEAEEKRLKKPKSAAFPDFDGGYASCEEDIADRLAEIRQSTQSGEGR